MNMKATYAETMLEVRCTGTPYEIGFEHGVAAKAHISRTIDFYAGVFRDMSKMSWAKVQELAMTFEPVIRKKWPAYFEEMRGLAEGAGVDLEDIVAINVRTEIAFGLFSDGCTALSWRTDNSSFLAQNWDWMEAQKSQLIILTIVQNDKPTIKMITEAGLIGKIGLNSAGVGVCLNAIKAKGLDTTRIPCHLGLRMVLESRSRSEAVQRLETFGIASACHMLIADPTGGLGVEWSAVEHQKVPMNASRQVFHTNHYLVDHPGIIDTNWLDDSNFRVKRVEELCNKLGASPRLDEVAEVFKDEVNYPGSICRAEKPPSEAATLFNIVMDLEARTATITLGRPVQPESRHVLSFTENGM